MSKIISIFVIAVVCFSTVQAKILIQNVKIVSPHRIGLHPKKDVLIHKGLIKEIAEPETLKVRSKDTKIDGKGLYLIPGLINSWVFIENVPGVSQTETSFSPEQMDEYYKKAGDSWLRNGFTTLIDHSKQQPNQKRFQSYESFPDVFHFSQFKNQVRSKARDQLQKIFRSRPRDFFEYTIYRTKNSTKVVSHMYDHLTKFMLQDGIPNDTRTILDQVNESKAFYMPSVVLLKGEYEYFNPTSLDRAEFNQIYPKFLVAWHENKPQNTHQQKLLSKYTERIKQKRYKKALNLSIAQRLKGIRYLTDFNGKLLFGTATPSKRYQYLAPGFSETLQIKYFRKAKVSSDRLFKSLTIEPVNAFGLENVGTIERGKKANLLLLNKNPLANPKAYQEISTVILNGKVIAQ